MIKMIHKQGRMLQHLAEELMPRVHPHVQAVSDISIANPIVVPENATVNSSFLPETLVSMKLKQEKVFIEKC